MIYAQFENQTENNHNANFFCELTETTKSIRDGKIYKNIAYTLLI